MDKQKNSLFKKLCLTKYWRDFKIGVKVRSQWHLVSFEKIVCMWTKYCEHEYLFVKSCVYYKQLCWQKPLPPSALCLPDHWIQRFSCTKII